MDGKRVPRPLCVLFRLASPNPMLKTGATRYGLRTSGIESVSSSSSHESWPARRIIYRVHGRCKMTLPLWIIPVVIIIIYLFSSIKILREYERGVIFRLGRVLPEPKGPGIFLVFAPIDRMVRTSLRIEAMEVPAQDVITRDNVTVKVNAVVYFRVIDPTKAVIEVTNYLYATSQLSQTSLRSVLGEVELDALLSQREKLNVRLQSVLDQNTGPWGIKVTMVEVKQVDLPEQMIRAIARQAEAERERRAKIIHAEGEAAAAANLEKAAETMARQPGAIQLRYLQTLVEIGSEKNTTVVFPLPMDLLSSLGQVLKKLAGPEPGGSA